MWLGNLPDDIIIMLLKHASSSAKETPAVFKQNLPLLSVCSRFRMIALPMVYSFAFAEYGVASYQPETTEQGSDLQEITEPSDFKISSNIDLIAFAQCIDHVKSMSLLIYHITNPLSGLNSVIDLLRSHGVWTSVALLTLSFDNVGFLLSSRIRDVSRHKHGIDQVQLAIGRVFPNVNSMRFNGTYPSSFATDLCSKLSSGYSNKLAEINSIYPICIPEPQKFTQLTSMRIRVYGSNYYSVPRACASTLVKLYLQDGAANNKCWSSFALNADNKSVEFTNLKSLSWLSNTENTQSANVAERIDYKLYFPSLEHLVVSNSSRDCPLLQAAVLPQHLKSVEIQAPREVHEQFAKVNITSVGKLAANVSTRSQEDVEGICHVVNRQCAWIKDNNVTITIRGYGLKASLSDLQFSKMCKLNIQLSVDVETLLSIVSNVSSLESLGIRNLEVTNIPLDVVSIGDYSLDLLTVKPIDSRLETVDIMFNRTVYATSSIVPVAKYLLLKLRMLKVLLLTPGHKAIKEFIEKHKHVYPHLVNVRH